MEGQLTSDEINYAKLTYLRLHSSHEASRAKGRRAKLSLLKLSYMLCYWEARQLWLSNQTG